MRHMTSMLCCDDGDADDMPQKRERGSVASRVAKSGDGGKEVGGGSRGAAIPPNNWEKGEFFDAAQAKDGLIDPSEGDVYFRADEDRPAPHTNRTYRGNAWKPASGDGSSVQMPYSTQ